MCEGLVDHIVTGPNFNIHSLNTSQGLTLIYLCFSVPHLMYVSLSVTQALHEAHTISHLEVRGSVRCDDDLFRAIVRNAPRRNIRFARSHARAVSVRACRSILPP
jgi:hypothetical protein